MAKSGQEQTMRGVGGSGVEHGGILCQEVERAACQSESHHQQFVFPTVRMEFCGVEEQQEVGDGEAQREDMGW